MAPPPKQQKPKKPGVGSVAPAIGSAATGYAINQSINSGAGAATSQALGMTAPSTPVVVGAKPIASTVPQAAPGILGPWAVPLGAAGVAAYYGPSAIKHGSNLVQGKDTKNSGIMGAALTNPMTAWAVPIADALGISFGGKERGHQIRDSINEVGLEEGKYLTLADGTRIRVRDDGPEGIKGALNTPGGKMYNINWDDPNTAGLVGAADPLVHALVGKNEQYEQLVAEFVNGSQLGGDPMANMRGFYEQRGMDRETVYNKIASDTTLDEGTKSAYLASIDRVFGVAAPAQQAQAPRSSGGSRPSSPAPQAPAPAAPLPVAPVAEQVPAPPITTPQLLNQPEPDDEPDTAEQSAVANYQDMLSRFARAARGGR